MMFLSLLDMRVCHSESVPWWMYLGKFWWPCDQLYSGILYKTLFCYAVSLKTFGL